MHYNERRKEGELIADDTQSVADFGFGAWGGGENFKGAPSLLI